MRENPYTLHKGTNIQDLQKIQKLNKSKIDNSHETGKGNEHVFFTSTNSNC